jgi:hypothetical protein
LGVWFEERKIRERSSHPLPLGLTNTRVKFPDQKRQPHLPWRKLPPIAISENKKTFLGKRCL